MSKKANPTAVGLFVMIGSALLVAGFISFSNFEWKGRSETFLLYFDSSVKGLSVGAPVTHRGVTIGAVTEILLRHDQAVEDKTVPVFIEIKQSLVQARVDNDEVIEQQLVLQDMIDAGLRGRLEAASLLTGQLYIDLAFVDNPPPPQKHQMNPEFSEIPTMPTGIQAMLDSVAKVDIAGMTDRLTSILEQLDRVVREIDMERISAGLTEVMSSINSLVSDSGLQQAIQNASDALKDFEQTSRTLRTESVKVSDGISEALVTVQLAVDELKEGVADLRHTLSTDSTVVHNLSVALDDIASASQAIAELANFLRLHPNALISGREPTTE
jgi:paraquat-inducible protein B